MRLAALDVGSNSFHLIVGQVVDGGRFEILDRAKEMVRLGESTLRSGIIPPEVFRRGLDALGSLRRIADRHQPDALLAVATSAVREAQNGGEFVRAARDELGIDIRVIRGQEEARLIYLGARGVLDLAGRRVALFDVGGGSTEIILADAQECYFTSSQKLGVIRLREEYLVSDPPTPAERAALGERVRSVLDPVITRVRAMGFDFVALTSGTAFALDALGTGGEGRAGGTRTLSFRTIFNLEHKLSTLSSSERARLPGIDPRRADTILPGAVLLRTILELTGADQAVLCEPALREGIIAEYIAKNRPGIQLAEEFPDLRRRSVMELARRSRYHQPHAHQVARLALSIFRQTRQLHHLSNSDGQLLEYAALLHDIGFYISAHRHHRHTQYLIESHEMRGFSPEETAIIALIARHHRKAAPRRSHGAVARLPKAAQKKVRMLAAILRVADSLDRTHALLVREVRCTVTKETIELRIEADDDPELELWAARRKGDLLEELTGRKLRFALDGASDARDPADTARTQAAAEADSEPPVPAGAPAGRS